MAAIARAASRVVGATLVAGLLALLPMPVFPVAATILLVAAVLLAALVAASLVVVPLRRRLAALFALPLQVRERRLLALPRRADLAVALRPLGVAAMMAGIVLLALVVRRVLLR